MLDKKEKLAIKVFLLSFLIGLTIFVSLKIINAEQIIWNNDDNITIFDSWKDIDGTPLTGETCSFVLYNNATSRNQSGLATELSPGLINLSLLSLPTIGIYPLLLNCTKLGYNGTSTKDSIKIVDELPEGDKARLTRIENNTGNIITEFQEINTTLENIRFILQVNAPKFHLEAYEVPITKTERRRVALLISSNSIQGDPTVDVYVPVNNPEEVELRNNGDEAIPSNFRKDIEGKAYINFGSVVERCSINQGSHDREYNCKASTYFLAFYNNDTNVSNIQVKQEDTNLVSLFDKTAYGIKVSLIIAFVVGAIVLLIIFILVIVILQKVSRRRNTQISQ